MRKKHDSTGNVVHDSTGNVVHFHISTVALATTSAN